MAYNSDYDVRLATLGALGGDTAKTYDSVYDIDLAILDAIEHGKQLLAASGVTEILFIGNGSGETVTLDYDLISQIGQGGGDYICVEGIEALSGITEPKDGMLAYVGAHDEILEKKVVVTDYYDKDWFHINVEWNDQSTAMLSLRTGGNDVDLTNGHFDDGQGSYGDIHNHKDKMPYKMIFNNGAVGYVAHQEYGSTYPDHFETILTIWFDKYDGEYPTITFDYSEDGVLVSTAVTVENVTWHYETKGYYKYYADIQKWQPYQIYVENYNSAELQTLFGEYTTYFKPLMAYFKDGADEYKDSWKIGVAHIYDKYDGNPEWKVGFTCIGREYWGYCSIFEIRYFKWNGERWQKEGSYRTGIPTHINIKEEIGRKIYTQSMNEDTGIYDGGLYSVGVNKTVSGVTISTTINFDAIATSENHIATIYNKQSGRGMWEQLCEDGWLFTQGMGMSATTNAEWFVTDYIVNNDTDIRIAAVKIEDNGNNTFTVTYFLTDDNWNSDYWDDDHRGETEHYQFYVNDERGYTWTVTEHQTLTVAPHLYTKICFTHKDNSNARYIHPFVSHKTAIMTEAEYQTLAVKDPNTIYYLTSN